MNPALAHAAHDVSPPQAPRRGARLTAARWYAMMGLRVRLVSAVAILKVLAWFSAPRAARWFDRQFWHRPLRYPEPARERALLATATRVPIAVDAHTIDTWTWGDGPVVLLMHGWSGRGAQLGAFVEPLVARGLRVVTFDAPAHGRAPGQFTNFPEIAAVAAHIAKQYGSVHAVIAHSAGCVPAMLALRGARAPQRAVFISPFASLQVPLEHAYRQLRLPPAVTERHLQLLRAQYGADVLEAYSPGQLVRGFAAAGLIVHDQNDTETPAREAERLAQHWAQARVSITSGLGHYRVLRDARVVQDVAAFVTAAR